MPRGLSLSHLAAEEDDYGYRATAHFCGNSRVRCRSAALTSLSAETSYSAGLTIATDFVLVGFVLISKGLSRGVGDQHFLARPHAYRYVVKDPVALTVDFPALGPPATRAP